MVFQKFIETTLIPSMKAPAIAALITQTPFLEGFEFSTSLNSYLVNLILVEVGELLYDGYAGNFYLIYD